MTLFKINIIYKVIIFKTEYYWHRLGSVEQWTLKRDSWMYRTFLYNRDGIKIRREGMDWFKNGPGI